MTIDHRFLIDECLTSLLVVIAKRFGHEAQHVLTAKLGSTPDRVIAEAAVSTQAILVTSNGRDFRRLYAKLTTHPGLVIVASPTIGAEQVVLFERVIQFIEEQPSVLDQLIEINRKGRITMRPWPTPNA